MATPGISENMGLYTQHHPKRPRAGQPIPPRVEPESEHARDSGSDQQPNQNPAGGNITPQRNRIPTAAQFQQYAEQEGLHNYSRMGQLSLRASQALSTYAEYQHQEKREEITQLMGLDVYV